MCEAIALPMLIPRKNREEAKDKSTISHDELVTENNENTKRIAYFVGVHFSNIDFIFSQLPPHATG